jgi:hypothetical protein
MKVLAPVLGCPHLDLRIGDEEGHFWREANLIRSSPVGRQVDFSASGPALTSHPARRHQAPSRERAIDRYRQYALCRRYSMD